MNLIELPFKGEALALESEEMQRESQRDLYEVGRGQEPRDTAIGGGKSKQVGFF